MDKCPITKVDETRKPSSVALSKASLWKVSRRCRKCALYWRSCPFATCPLGHLSATEGFSSRISRNIYFMPVDQKKNDPCNATAQFANDSLIVVVRR